MPETALKSILQSRWQGAAIHGQVAPLAGWRTGIESVDQALGPIGIPRGRLTEIFGAFSCGKTTLAYALLADRIAAGDLAAYIDPESTLFAPAARSAGIDVSRLIVVRPRSAQALLRAVDALVRGGACSVVILDASNTSVLQTHHCARLVAQAEKTGTALVVLSHGRNTALASFATLRLCGRGVAPLWQSGADGGDQLLGYAIDMEIAKARTVAPGKSFSFNVYLPEVMHSWPSGIVAEVMADPPALAARSSQVLASAANL